MNDENLSERKREILFSAVEDYIQFANPITSGSVHDKYIKNISPATLRNELSALEAMGYLKQLHTSSGRIPTTKAYRLYVNQLMRSTTFGERELNSVREILSQRTAYLSDIIRLVAGAVSQVTNYPAFVVMDGYDNLPIDGIKIIPLIDKSALLLISTKDGIINGQFPISNGITEENCIDASNLLTKHFSRKTIKYMRDNIQNEVFQTETEIDNFNYLCTNIIDCLTDMISQKKRVVRAGETKLLDEPEYANLESAKKVLSVINNDSEIKQVFESNSDENISFTIGKENSTEELKNCSVVKASYKIGGKKVASIGVIGPERMDYSNVASALKVIVGELGKLNLLGNSDAKDKNMYSDPDPKNCDGDCQNCPIFQCFNDKKDNDDNDNNDSDNSNND